MSEFVQVVLFGDSMSWSYHTPYGQRYADCLEEELGSRLGQGFSVDVAACGDGGNTAEEALPRVERDCVAYRPHAVVVSLGGNDAGRAPSRDSFMRAYRRLIETILKETGAPVAIETLPTLDEQRHAWRNSPQAFMHGGLEKYLEYFAHSHLRETAKARQLLLHDRFRLFHELREKDSSADERLVLPDGVHLTAAGNRFFARTLADLLLPGLTGTKPRRTGGASEWLGRAKSNVVFMEACAAGKGTGLKEFLTGGSLPVRLMLQQCRSFARRAAAYAEDPAVAADASLVSGLAAGLLAAERGYEPFDDAARRGSAQWGLAQLKNSDHPLARKLRETLSSLAG